MAVTKGHGNPNWSREEVILALELYHACDGRVPGPADHRVIALSEALRRLPSHALSDRKESFRNPAGVAFKLQNLRQVGTAKGLKHSSKIDQEIWDDFGQDPTKTRRAADLIRHGLELLRGEEYIEVSEDEEFAEGRTVTQEHKRRERHPGVRRTILKSRRSSGLSCDLCGYESTSKDADFASAAFECHHLVPLSLSAEVNTKAADVALLCAVCHRLIHRAISRSRRWLSLAEARTILFDA